MRRIYACIIVAFIALSSVIARAQTEPNSPQTLHVYLVTFGPGADPWEKFGHDCIVVEDENSSLAYNWGVFDFGQGLGGFLTFSWHFLQGRLLYSMQSDPTSPMLDAYAAAGRSILVQELRLTYPQKIDLRDHLQANDTEANRYYLYDYFKKNCTTMARDAIDQVVGGRIAATLKIVSTHATLRWQDRRTTADQLWLYTFLDFILGHEVDKPLSAYDECFLPGVLANRISAVEVPDSNGHLKSIVMSERVLNAGVYNQRQVPPASYGYGFLAGGITVAGLMTLLAVGGTRWSVFRWIFALSVMAWSLLTGLLGALGTFALFTNHEAAKWNENWFQGNPLSLFMIVLAPMAFRWPIIGRRVAITVLVLSAFGLIAKITPWFWQHNLAIIAAVLPIHAAVAYGIYRLTNQPNKTAALAAESIAAPIVTPDSGTGNQLTHTIAKVHD